MVVFKRKGRTWMERGEGLETQTDSDISEMV